MIAGYAVAGSAMESGILPASALPIFVVMSPPLACAIMTFMGKWTYSDANGVPIV